jgi:hypothetical protein
VVDFALERCTMETLLEACVSRVCNFLRMNSGTPESDKMINSIQTAIMEGKQVKTNSEKFGIKSKREKITFGG